MKVHKNLFSIVRSTHTGRTKQWHGGNAFDPNKRKLQASKWPESGAQRGPKAWPHWKVRLWRGAALMQSAAPTADPDAGCACSPRGIGRASTGSPLQVASKSQLRSRLQYAQRLWPPERLWRKQQAGCRGARPLKESHTTEGHQVSTTPREQLTPSQECCAHLHQKPPGGGSTSALSTIALCRETPPASRRRSDDVIAGEDRRTQEWLWSGCAGRRGGEESLNNYMEELHVAACRQTLYRTPHARQ